MTKIKKQFIFILIIFLSLFIFSARSVFAASASFTLPTGVDIGDNLDVTVNADTGGVLINSIEMVIGYDQNMLTFTGYSDNNSVIKIWINPPSAEAGKVSFSGIIPGGVDGLYNANKKGLSPFPVVHLFFTPKNPGTTNLFFIDSKILEGDGKGTPLAHVNTPINITIKNNPNGNVTPPQTSTSPPNTSINMLVTPRTPEPLFWIVILILIAGFLLYKLLKYKA
jgi:hypothetical protein